MPIINILANLRIVLHSILRSMIYRGLSKTTNNLVVLLDRLSAFGAYPGELFYLYNQTDNVPSICQMKARGESTGGLMDIGNGCAKPSDGNKHGPASLAYKWISSADGKYTLLVTRNLYTSQLDNSGQVDMKYFHTACETICEGCFAASPEHLNPLADKLGNGRYYVSGWRKPSGKTTTDNCEKKAGEHIKWKIYLHVTHPGSVMIAPDEWQAGFPNKQCSDQERYATAYHKGKLISVPIFDRLPLVCVSGNVPKMSTAAGFCFKNSQLDGKGGCRCKNGFEDALNPKFNLLAHAKAEGVDNLPGYICVSQDCNHKSSYHDTVVFAIDGSGSTYCSWDETIALIYKAYQWLPRKSRLIMIQFADELKDMYITDTLGGGWSDAVFHKVTRGAFETRISGQYDNTHGAVHEVVRRWNSMTPSRRKALLVLFTDGAIDKPEAVSIGKARSQGMDVKLINMAGCHSPLVSLSWSVEEVKAKVPGLFKDDEIIEMKDLENNVKALTEFFCEEVTTADFDAAMDP